MDVDVRADGLQEVAARLHHAHDGILDLSRDLGPQLEKAAPPMVVHDSLRMRPRSWGAGDVWTLPAGGWITPRVQLPDDLDLLTAHVQDLLDGH